MTGILLCCFVILLCVGSLYLIIWHEPLVAAWWYRLVRDPEPYDKSFAEAPDPVNEVHDGYQRAAWFTGTNGNTCPVVPGNHPLDCWERCCIDIRVAEFDWHAAEHEMRSKR